MMISIRIWNYYQFKCLKQQQQQQQHHMQCSVMIRSWYSTMIRFHPYTTTILKRRYCYDDCYISNTSTTHIKRHYYNQYCNGISQYKHQHMTTRIHTTTPLCSRSIILLLQRHRCYSSSSGHVIVNNNNNNNTNDTNIIKHPNSNDMIMNDHDIIPPSNHTMTDLTSSSSSSSQDQQQQFLLLLPPVTSSSGDNIINSNNNNNNSKKRKPLRKKTKKNSIGEQRDQQQQQRLHHSRGIEYEQNWNTYLKKYETFVNEVQKLQKDDDNNHNENSNNNEDSHNNDGTMDTIVTSRSRIGVLPRDGKLRAWLMRIRIEYQKFLRGKPTRLTDLRIQQLRNLGFHFVEVVHRNSWDIRYQQLCQYLHDHNGQHPHEALASLNEEELDLYHWCSRQRVLYKLYESQNYDKTYITKERIQKLDDIHFLWSIYDAQWYEKYAELKQYYKIHGNTMVPARYVGNYSLARWVERHRYEYRKRMENKPHQLTDERMELLNQLDFVWDPYELRWLERYYELVEFQRLNGDGVIPRGRIHGNIPRWVSTQIRAYFDWIDGKPSKMNQQRKERLDKLGIVWVRPKKKKKEKENKS